MSNTNFWSNQNQAPKRSYRFMIEIGGEAVWWAKNVNTPSFDVGEIEHSFLGGKYYFPGKVSWSTVTMTLVDPIQPDSVGFTNSLLAASGYIVPKDVDSAAERQTVDKVTAINLSGLQINIIVLDANGEEIEIWTLNQAFIKSAKYGDLSYEDENLRTVDIEWRFDWASCEFPDTHPDTDLKNKNFFGKGATEAGPKDYGRN